MLTEHTHNRIAENLVNIGAVSFEDYLDGRGQTAPVPQLASQALTTESVDANAITRLHHACQRAFRSTDALKFEYIEQSSSRNKQCILTITKPDGVRRSYATQSIFAKKNEAKAEAARIAIDMGALDFLTLADGTSRDLAHPSAEASNVDNTAVSDAMSVHSEILETFVDDIEQSCLKWRAGSVTPYWVPFFDTKLVHKQGCALRVRLSPHVVRVYLSNPTFDTFLDAKQACAKAAVFEGVLDFIKYGNGQTHPPSPRPPSPSAVQIPPTLTATTPWTLQAFYESLPRPFPESFDNNDASEINAPAWLNSLVQNARGGKLVLSFFSSDGSPGLHGCLLKLNRPGEYKASLVDARFPKRSDAKAAVCLQAMSEGIGDYIRSITTVVESKITSAMRSFSSSLVYPAMVSELSKISTELHPLFEYDKERDAFGATLTVRLSTSPAPEQVRRYNVSADYRNKADAKVAVICHAAEQGAVEFVRFRGSTPPNGYVSPYVLSTYNLEASRKQKRSASAEDAEQGRSPKKKKKKGKQLAEVISHDEGSRLTPVGQYLSIRPSGDQIHGISGPGDMGLSQSIPTDGVCDPSQLGVRGGGGSGATRPAVYSYGASYNAQMHASSYPAVLDPRLAAGGALSSRGYSVYPLPGAPSGDMHSLRAADAPLLENSPSRTMPGTSVRPPRRQVEHAELEPGEVVSSAESDFSESSSRNEEVAAKEPDTDVSRDGAGNHNVDGGNAARKSQNKGKESSSTSTTMISRDGPSAAAVSGATSHVKNLINYCATRHCGTPSFHESQSESRFQVWIVIGKERFDLPTTYATAEEGRQRVAKQVLARLSKGVGATRG